MKRVKPCLQFLFLTLLAIAFIPEPGIARPLAPLLNQPNRQTNRLTTAEPIAQATEPMDFLDQPEGVVNCIATGTSNVAPWDHRFTYWLSGIAQFDEQGNMQPIPASQSKDWLLTITNSRFHAPMSYPLTPLNTQSRDPEFSFPAVSQDEWERLGKRPSRRYTTAFSYDEASHGLYVAIRNTETIPTVRQMFQVIHYLSENVIIVSEASPCFIGPRPPSPLELSRPLDGTEPRENSNLD